MRLIDASGEFTRLQPGDKVRWVQQSRSIAFSRETGRLRFEGVDDKYEVAYIRNGVQFDILVHLIAAATGLKPEMAQGYPHPTYIFSAP